MKKSELQNYYNAWGPESDKAAAQIMNEAYSIVSDEPTGTLEDMRKAVFGPAVLDAFEKLAVLHGGALIKTTEGITDDLAELGKLGFQNTGDKIGEWQTGYGIAANGSVRPSESFSCCPVFLPIPPYATEIDVYNAVTDGYVVTYTGAITRDGMDGFIERQHYSAGRHLIIPLDGTAKYVRISMRYMSDGQVIEGATPATATVTFRMPLTDMLDRIEHPVVEKHKNGLGPMLEIAETYFNAHYSGDHPFDYQSSRNLFANEIETDDGECAMQCSGLVEACLYAVPFARSRYVNGPDGVNERESWGMVTDGTGGYAGIREDNATYENYNEGDPEYKLTGQLIKYFELRGELIPYNHKFVNMKPGDLLFFVGDEEDNSANDPEDNSSQSGDDIASIIAEIINNWNSGGSDTDRPDESSASAPMNPGNTDQTGEDSASVPMDPGNTDDQNEETGHYKDARHVAICLGAQKSLRSGDEGQYCTFRLMESATYGEALVVMARTTSPKSWGKLGYVTKCPVEAEYTTTKVFEDSNRYAGAIGSSTAQAVYLTLPELLPRGFYTVRIEQTGNNPTNLIWLLQDEDYEDPTSSEEQPWSVCTIKGRYLKAWTTDLKLDADDGTARVAEGYCASAMYYILPKRTKWISVQNDDPDVSGVLCVYEVGQTPPPTFVTGCAYSGGEKQTITLDDTKRYCVRLSATGEKENGYAARLEAYAYDFTRSVYADNNCGIASFIVYLKEPTRRFSIRAVKGGDENTDYNYDIRNISIYKGYYPD